MGALAEATLEAGGQGHARFSKLIAQTIGDGDRLLLLFLCLRRGGLGRLDGFPEYCELQDS